ncbi:MAG: nitrile hydratase accessory protein [Candidatus Dormibacteraeota bacterium]|nr:nitrile hydratase accessory protein [Candidatus Dormibacteraeota bacterium]
MQGQAALPRRNGELVFDAPWQGRAFGIALGLHEAGVYDWEEFRQRLIQEVGADEQRDYYERWLAALERLAVERGLVTAGEYERRVAEYRSGERDEVF